MLAARGHPGSLRFLCQQIAARQLPADLHLAPGRSLTRRATLWRRTNNDWQIVYHQGTVVADA